MASRFNIALALFLILWLFQNVLLLNSYHGASDVGYTTFQSFDGVSFTVFSGFLLQSACNCQIRNPVRRIMMQSKFNIKFPVYKAGKHGQTTLALPSKVFVIDLTVYSDIEKNLGPEIDVLAYPPNLPLKNVNLCAAIYA